MKPTDPHIEHLFRRYLDGSLADSELKELIQYFDLDRHSEELHERLYAQFEQDIPATITAEDRVAALLKIEDNVLKHVGRSKRKIAYYRWVQVAAAAVLLVLSTVIFFRSDEPSTTIAKVEETIMPGTNRAVLTLDDETPIELYADHGLLRNQGDTISYGDGQSIAVTHAMQWATLRTPRAGQYQVVLEDGTKVWLNAASYIRYPTRFVGTERKVSVSGEAYFEVAHRRDKPFIVETDKQSIQVLGTTFNVQAYPDGNGQSTTLVSGQVEVTATQSGTVHQLRPNQQARMTDSGKLTVVPIDAEEYTAWIDGWIVMNNMDLKQVATQLERWYDVTFDPIPSSIGKRKVFGSLKRDLPLHEVLQALENNYDVLFTIKERRVEVRSR